MLKCYLGDGAYAGFDGYHIWVWTEREEGTHAIAFEPETMAALTHYVANLKRMARNKEDLKRERM
jgi:hypothetical protein